MPLFRVVGPGRAGRSLAVALSAVGWESVGLLGLDLDLFGVGRRPGLGRPELHDLADLMLVHPRTLDALGHAGARAE